MQIRLLLTTLISVLLLNQLVAQNIFDPNDPLVRYSASAPLGSPQRPNPDIDGLQKWVSTPVTGISTGGGSFDVSPFKAYFLKVGNARMAFRIRFPKNYTNPAYADSTFPAMVFFHGAGEFACNSNNGYYNNEKQLTHGAKFFNDKVNSGAFDGFLIYPHLNSGSNCWGAWGGVSENTYGLVIKMVDSLVKYARLNPDRVIATGLSAGGTAVWHAASGYYQVFAAAAPSAASAPGATKWDDIVHLPFWMASGGKDNSPTPGTANLTYQTFLSKGGNIRYSFYPDLGHTVWNNHWNEPDFIPFLKTAHKANPLIFFQRDEFCPEDPVNVKLGISAGFYAYEWQRNGVTIATKTGNTVNIIDNNPIISFTGNEITVKMLGTYRVRFKRKNTSEWSEWSLKPAVIKSKNVTQTPNIFIDGLNSKVLPSPDNKTTVPLTLPGGYVGYRWYDAQTEALLDTNKVFNAPPGTYKAKVIEAYGCGTLFSANFKVVDESGGPKPDAVKGLTATAVSAAAIRLDWNQNPNASVNETGFEIYKSKAKSGPYTLVHITGPDVVTWTDNNIENNSVYYYFVRAVNDNGAAANSNIAQVITLDDEIPPSAPSNLRYRGATQNSVELAWDAATDNGFIDRYDVYANGVKMYSTTNTKISVFGLNPNTYYTFYVKAVDKGGNESIPSNQVTGYTHQQGLNYAYYEGNWDNLPNFNSISPKKTGVISDVSNGSEFRNVADYYAVKWEGYIYIPETGNWTFYTTSDDGSKLYVGLNNYSFSATALVNNDGLHGSQERSGSINLTRGYHKIIITFFEKTGSDIMEVRWQNTAAGVSKEIIPSGFFALSPVTLPAIPNTPTGLALNTVSFNQLRLTWNDNSNNETGFEIQRSTASNGPFVHVATVGANVTQFIDSGLNANTRYYYRIKAVNDAGASAFSGTVNALTSSAPAAPAVPGNLTAVPVSSEVINISFTDNSNNETGFELWRSVGNTNNFLLLHSFPAANGGTINYSDTGLFANVVYYYRVRALGVVNNSGYSATVNAKTLNNKPSIRSITDFSVQRQTTFEFEVEAKDPDNDVLQFSMLQPLPNFVTYSNPANGVIKFAISPRIFNSGFFQIHLMVDDGFEGRDTAIINFIVSENAVPSFPDIPTIVVKEGAEYTHEIQMTDDQDYDHFQFSVIDFPDFVTTENLGNGKVRIKVAPGYDKAGNYDGYLKVDDGYGAVTFRRFYVTVEEKDPNELVQVNFKYFTGNVNGWNDIKLPENPPVASPGNYFAGTNLLNTRGENTGIGITPISGTYNSAQSGLVTGNNSGVFPDNIIKDQITWGFQSGSNANDTVQLKVSGLSSTKHYNFIFFSSYSCFNCGTDQSQTTFVINQDTARVRYYNNINRTDTIFNVIPDASGEVIIKMIGDPNINYGGVLNALVIDARYDDSTAPAKPQNFTGEFIVNSGVELTWTDFAYNEYSYKVFRSTSRSGPYENLNPEGNNRDSEFYFDNTIQPMTTYYYYVVGENNYGFGLTSDTIEVITGNNKPTITALQDMFIKSNTSHYQDFTVNDDPVDNLEVYILNKPAFVELVNLGNNQYRIQFNPTKGNLGVYDIVAVVDDGKGAQASSAMKLYVMDKDTRSFYVNFGDPGYEAPLPWNNWMGGLGTNFRINNLKDENGLTTNISIQTILRIPATQNFGFITGINSGPYPDKVLESGLLKRPNIANDGQFMIYNLNPNMRYNLYVLSSANEGTQSRMQISSGSQTYTIDSRYNSHKLGSLTNLAPSATGELYLTMKALDSDAGGMMYVNALVIEEYSPSLEILSPIHLYAEVINKTSAKVIWTDRSWNEDQVGGMLLERSTDSLFQSNTTVISLNRNVDTYIDNNLQPNTRYFYRVRAKSGSVYSEYSNVARIVTPANIVYINFNGEHANAPSPWNNLQSNPTELVTIENLKADNGVNTGMSISIVKPFFGENNSGKQVGNTGVLPDLVLASNYWIDNTNIATMKLSGLSHAKKFRIGFFNSISAPGWFYGHYTATYTIGDRTVYLNSWDNYTKIVYIDDVKADANGEIYIDFSTTEASPWAFYGGMIVESFDDYDMLTSTAVVPLENELTANRSGGQGNSLVKVSTYPNPFVDQVNFEFSNSRKSDQALVEIYDLSGRLVLSKSFNNLPAGRNTLTLDLSDHRLLEGTYISALKVGEEILEVTKLIKVKK